MQFVKLNWWKLFTVFIGALILLECTFGLIYLHERGTTDDLAALRRNILLFPPLFLSAFWSVFMFFINLILFYIARSIYSDKSDSGLATVFDNNDYEIGTVFNSNPFIYTKECLRGKILDFPTSITYRFNPTPAKNPSMKKTVSSLEVTIKAINKWGKSARLIYNLPVNLRLNGKLHDDVKPDIIDYTTDYKNKGGLPDLSTE